MTYRRTHLPHINQDRLRSFPPYHAYSCNIVHPRCRTVGVRLKLSPQHGRCAVSGGRQTLRLYIHVRSIISLQVVPGIGTKFALSICQTPVGAEVQNRAYADSQEDGVDDVICLCSRSLEGWVMGSQRLLQWILQLGNTLLSNHLPDTLGPLKVPPVMGMTMRS